MPNNTDNSGSGRAERIRRLAIAQGPSVANLRVGSMANKVPIDAKCCSQSTVTPIVNLPMIIAIFIPSAGGTISFLLNAGEIGTVVVNWGDGTSDTYISTQTGGGAIATHTYSSSGRFKIYLSGGIGYLSAISGAEFMTAVDQWATPGVIYLISTFANAVNLVSLPNVAPLGTTNLSYLLSGATSFNQDLSSWDLTRITAANNIFCNCPLFNQPAKYPKFPPSFPPAGDPFYGC